MKVFLFAVLFTIYLTLVPTLGGRTKMGRSGVLPSIPRWCCSKAPVTEAAPTVAPVTEAPPTVAPVTEAPPTVAPATDAPATEAPSTEAPPTEASDDECYL